MRRIGLAVILTVGLTLAPHAGDAQPPGKVYRIGYLGTNPPPAHQWDALLDGLRERGYIEGRNIVFERRFSEGKRSDSPSSPPRWSGLESISSWSQRRLPLSPPRMQPRRFRSSFLTAIDPVGAGLVASLARPGGNITGLSVLAPELSGKRLELLKEVVPGMTRVAVLWNAANPANALTWKEMQAAAGALGLMLHSQEVRGPQDLKGAFALTAKVHPDALLALADSLLSAYRQQIVEFATQQHLPSVFYGRDWVVAGGLMSYGPSVPDLYRRAATYVDKILKGAKPADLPVEQPTKFELVINMKTAKALGLTIPQSLLVRADEIIQ